MKPVDQIKEDVDKKDKSRFLTFIIFLIISTVLWFLIKLSKNYSTQSEFLLDYTEVPVNKWVSTPQQTVKVSFDADGFVTLRHHLVSKQKRVVEIPLNEVPYRLEGGFTYSYSSQYVVEQLAHQLGIPSSSVTITDEKQYFNMEDLQSKELEVVVPLEVQTQQQYALYGRPKVVPDRVTVYGPKNLLDTLTRVTTEPFHEENANSYLRRTLVLDLLDGAIRCEVDRVEVTVPVEQYTEMDIDVPVSIADSLQVRFFPETVKVKCMIPICDYAAVGASSFQVLADTAQLHRMEPLLDVGMVKQPENVQVVKMEPLQVEYLILN